MAVLIFLTPPQHRWGKVRNSEPSFFVYTIAAAEGFLENRTKSLETISFKRSPKNKSNVGPDDLQEKWWAIYRKEKTSIWSHSAKKPLSSTFSFYVFRCRLCHVMVWLRAPSLFASFNEWMSSWKRTLLNRSTALSSVVIIQRLARSISSSSIFCTQCMVIE